MDPLAGYIARVQKDVTDRQKERQEANPRVYGAAKLLSAEDATKAAYVNRLSAEINEITSGIKNMRDALEVLDIAENAYDDVMNVLKRMEDQISQAQTAEDLGQNLTSDSSVLTAALNTFSADITSIISTRQFNQENLIDGTFTNKVFPMWSGETSSRSISLEDINETVKSYRSYSALALAGNVNNAISGNQIDAQNAGNDIVIGITTASGSNTFTQLDGESASSLASRINDNESKSSTAIGILATVRSSVRLNDLSAAGTISLQIASERKSMAYTDIGNVVITDKDDLSELAATINRFSNSTGILASMGITNRDVILNDRSGGNIGISDFTHSVNNATLTTAVDRRDGLTDFALNGEDENAAGNELYNAGGNVTSGFSGGSITFGSVGTALKADNILLPTSNAGDQTVGSVSIDSSKNVYMGTGSGTIRIGTVDGTLNGIGEGTALKIDFNAAADDERRFANGTFAADSDWIKNTSQIISGSTQLDGETTKLDGSFPAGNAQGASGTLTVNGGSNGDTISAVSINGVNLLGSSVTYSTNHNTTAALIRNSINSNTSSPNYTATVSNAVITITALDNSGTDPNSFNISSTGDGSFAATGTGLAGGVDNDKASITGGSPFSTSISGGNLTMTTSNAATTYGYTVVKGPAVISQNAISLAVGEIVSFDYTASGQNGDQADVQAYLVNADNNRKHNMLNSTTSSSSGSISHTVTRAGNYRFVFVSGAFDNDGDGDSSSIVTLDNVAVSNTTSTMIDIIKNNVTYENLHVDASTSNANPQISIITVTGGGTSHTDAINVPPTMAGYTLGEGADQEVFATGEVNILSQGSFSISQGSATNTGDTFWENASPTVETLDLFTGSLPINGTTSLVMQNAVERINFAIKNVTDVRDRALSAYRSQFDVGQFDTSRYLDSLNTTMVKEMETNFAMELSQKTAKMIIADEIQSLLYKAGNASSDDIYELIKST